MFDVSTLDFAAHADQRRRVVDHPQPRRIVRLAERDQRDAEPARSGELALGVRARVDANGLWLRRRAAPVRQRVEGGARAAAMIDQAAEGARSDVVAADEAQPVEPLLVGQAYAFGDRVVQLSPRQGGSIAQRRADHNRRRGRSDQALAAGVGGLLPIFGSVPAISRAMLPRCMIQISAVRIANSSAGVAADEKPQQHRRGRARDQARQRRIARQCRRDRGPDRAEGRPRPATTPRSARRCRSRRLCRL